MANVLLLRAPTQGQDDRYEATFTEAGYHPLSVPVLETISTNLEILEGIVEAGPSKNNLEGVVLTSARACEAWESVVGELTGASIDKRNDDWSSVPFYVVGPGTASVLEEVRRTYGQTPYTPQVICGQSSGTGERLAQFIRDQPEGKPKKLLYLTGDKNKDTVPSILGEAGIELLSLKVYETQGSRTFQRDLEHALGWASTELERWWIVHFAPSAAGFVTPILNNHFDFESAEPDTERSISRPRVAAIGPVTAAFLRDELKIRVDATSSKPTPEDLLAAIVAHDQASGP
ncbi:putative uroporphyrinogen-III synthase HemD [Lyophyllum shimeji]|uniref:Uroporphyrinogen-III synthase HemD n=1 Tax=Lyophyllum shimeji TaxID=47721 RepID=A0A9P3UTU8_LYOSH|nr:putative uroporphyrinogen-III synthase HemD [Lyophyllum shimeji]